MRGSARVVEHAPHRASGVSTGGIRRADLRAIGRDRVGYGGCSFLLGVSSHRTVMAVVLIAASGFFRLEGPGHLRLDRNASRNLLLRQRLEHEHEHHGLRERRRPRRP